MPDPRSVTLDEFDEYLRTVNNRDGRPYEEATINAYVYPAKALDAWMTANSLDGDFTSCWRIGQHPAAGGQFLLCYRHHPDYQGTKPTHELIQRLHREHLERQAAIHAKLSEVHEHLVTEAATANDMHGPGAPTPAAQASRNHQPE